MFVLSKFVQYSHVICNFGPLPQVASLWGLKASVTNFRLKTVSIGKRSYFFETVSVTTKKFFYIDNRLSSTGLNINLLLRSVGMPSPQSKLFKDFEVIRSIFVNWIFPWSFCRDETAVEINCIL